MPATPFRVMFLILAVLMVVNLVRGNLLVATTLAMGALCVLAHLYSHRAARKRGK